MRKLFNLDKSDLSWLEDKFERYKALDKEIAVRKEMLKMREHDTNIGGGRSNIMGKPVEDEVIRSLSDDFIKHRVQWKKGIEDTYRSSPQEIKDIIDDRYFNNPEELSWVEVGDKHHKSKSVIYRVRYNILEKFAEEIGYI